MKVTGAVPGPSTFSIWCTGGDLNPSRSRRGSTTGGDLRDRANTQETPSKPASAAISTIVPESPPQSTVLGAKSTPETPSADPDAALRAAIKAAVDGGDFDRVKALVAVLESSPRPAPVVDIASRRTNR